MSLKRSLCGLRGGLEGRGRAGQGRGLQQSRLENFDEVDNAKGILKPSLGVGGALGQAFLNPKLGSGTCSLNQSLGQVFLSLRLVV